MLSSLSLAVFLAGSEPGSRVLLGVPCSGYPRGWEADVEPNELWLARSVFASDE